MVLTPLPLNFATSRMENPLRSRLITSLYSAFICSSVFTEPTLRPSFPPFSIYRFRPDCNWNEILSRSNCAQVESVAIVEMSLSRKIFQLSLINRSGSVVIVGFLLRFLTAWICRADLFVQECCRFVGRREWLFGFEWGSGA
jgi:hypothetical protein